MILRYIPGIPIIVSSRFSAIDHPITRHTKSVRNIFYDGGVNILHISDGNRKSQQLLNSHRFFTENLKNETFIGSSRSPCWSQR